MTGYTQSFYWEKIKNTPSEKTSILKNFDKNKYQLFSLNLDNFKILLADVPSRKNIGSSPMVVVNFPDKKGNMERFQVSETSTLAPEIAIKYPNIKTYIGFSLDNPGARIRFSVTPQGLKTMSTYPNKPALFTVPLNKGDKSLYITYDRGMRIDSKKDFECLTENENMPIKEIISLNRDANDQILRTLRIAISTTGEYTNFWDDGDDTNGDAQEDAFAALVSTLNRTNEVFEVDMAITFQLVTGTEIIYPSASSDPYTGSFNSQLQSTLTSEVGESNYDIGHLFNYGGNNGNAGCIGCVCVDGQKGSGFSSHSFTDNDGGPNMDDFFDIDYVPHEIGHQMGGNHTFSQSNEGTGVNYEPGSGTTIMGYAGITGANDVQDHSDPYFHYGTINQVLNNLDTRTCWTSTEITNNPPVADAGDDYTIPQGTAFKLVGSATDSDEEDVLTYTWEQVDSGTTTSSNFGPTKTSGAVWRSRPPSTNPTRYMPARARVLSGELTETNPQETDDNTSWETVSTVGRALNFALTVRDRSETNGVGQFPQSDFDLMTVTVDGNSGPFAVTSQTTNETWNVGESQTVTWDVAGTDTGSVNTQTVNIRMSVDGGLTFPYVLATAVTNDGSHDVNIPVFGGDTSTARIMVEGNNNIFYAVNSININIQESEFVIIAVTSSVDVCSPDNAVFDLTYNTFLSFTDVTTFSVSGLPSGASGAFSPATATVDGTSFQLIVSGIGSIASGTYPLVVTGTSGSIVKMVNVTMNIFSSSINTPTLTSPANGAVDVLADGMLMWSTDASTQNYLVEVASDAGFASIVESNTLQTGTYQTSLSANTEYFWRVTPSSQCNTGATSSVFSFTTANLTCGSFDATDLPQTITTTGNIVYTSTINIGSDLPITDLNVTFGATHTWSADLDVFLISPAGTRVELTSDNDGGVTGADDYIDTVFDQEASTSITAGSAPFTGTFVPEGDLSVLYGEMSGGDWVLEVTDDAGADGGTFDRFTLELCVQGTILSTDDVLGSISNLSLYPNPSNGEFNLNFDTDGSNKVKLQLFDVAGRMVQEQDYTTTGARFSERVAFRRVAKGLYLLKIVNGSKVSAKKLIIE